MLSESIKYVAEANVVSSTRCVSLRDFFASQQVSGKGLEIVLSI